MIPDLKAIVTYGASIVAVATFVFGVYQYRRAQHWKRAEFLAHEMKELFENIKCTNALTMIDWAEREIPIVGLGNDQRPMRKAVSYETQSKALLPHTLAAKSAGTSQIAFAATETAADGLSHFSELEALIRDYYDALLDRFDRFGAYLDRGLLTVKDLSPYVGYYIDDIAAPASNSEEALWNVTLLTYIFFYHFDAIPILFRGFGRDISPDGHTFNQFVVGVAERDAKLAKILQELSLREYERFGTTQAGALP